MIAEWLLLADLLLLWIPRVEGTRLASIGLGGWRYLWWGALVYLLVLEAMMLSGFVLDSVGLGSIRSLQPMIAEYSLVTLLSLLVTGMFLEETFYRGYLMERLILVSGRVWVAAVVSWLAFTFVHLRFFGLGPTLDVSVLSAALVLLYVKERSVWPCVVVHVINSVLAYLVFPLMVA
ncbi:MAG: CPBP family intramembrane metalloprotease [Anaerolineae bacterium]|nr:CPBP family intramembrane metalloprotease [Anaerolineae bacterium]